jgi:hypothetical protein
MVVSCFHPLNVRRGAEVNSGREKTLAKSEGVEEQVTEGRGEGRQEAKKKRHEAQGTRHKPQGTRQKEA